jgi:hypothetical protein
MKRVLNFGMLGLLAMGFAACGSSESDLPDTSIYLPPLDAGAKDAFVALDTLAPDTAPAAIQYVNVVIMDTESKQPAAERAACGNGPGSDIDAVELIRAAVPVGYGLVGSAQLVAPTAGPYCDETDCSGNVCKYAKATLAPATEGKRNAKVNQSTDDVGYVSLNGGTLYLQIGNAITGGGTAQVLMSGDQLKIHEVDQTYKASGEAYAGCTCAAEHYEVWLQDVAGLNPVQLLPTKYEAGNTGCPAVVSATDTEGCGTTTFTIP